FIFALLVPALFLSFFLRIPPPPRSTLFPYTTLFRSVPALLLYLATSTVLTNRAVQTMDWLWPAVLILYAAQSVYSLVRGQNEHRSEEHTSELQSLTNLVCRLLLEKKKKSPTLPTLRL